MSDEFPAIAAMLAGFSGVDTIISRRGIGVDMSWLPGGGVHVDAAVDTSDESTTVDSDVDSVDEDSSSDEDNNQPYDAPIAKRTRRVFQRRPMKDSAWWKYFISPAAKAELLTDPDGKVARQFRQAFRVPYLLFKLKILDFAIELWWPDWNELKVDAFFRPVSNLELKLLGCLNVLGHGADHSSVGLQTNISEETHRMFFVDWISKMASVKEKFIYMPHEKLELDVVMDEYKSLGLPGCIGSVDVVHIGWDKCPVQHTQMYKGKEGYPTVAYQAICTSRKFIQNVSVGHPGARNDKHIVKTDAAVMQLLDGSSWFNSISWESMAIDGNVNVTKGVYLLCDGGYHRWPSMMFPLKSGKPGTPLMKWCAMVESVRKDIECTFGSLKQRFAYLKKFNQFKKKKNIDDAFTTCCILHNLLLEDDGWLADDLTNYPNGTKERLGKIFNDPRGDAITNRGDDDTYDPIMIAQEESVCPDEKKRLTSEWKRVLENLVDHREYYSNGLN
jgi:Plant transposon protein